MDWSKLKVVVLPERPTNRVYTSHLVQNLKKIALLYGIKLNSVKRIDSVIVMDTTDPVRMVHESAENAFGIGRVFLSLESPTSFSKIQTNVNHVGKKYLQRNEKFCIHATLDYLFTHKKAKQDQHTEDTKLRPADIELACNSSLIETLSNKGIKPASKKKCDKLFYVHMTTNYTYVSLLYHNGNGGLPQYSHNFTILCCVHDVFSALSCIQAIRMGFSVKMILCHSEYADLVMLSKIVARISKILLQKEPQVYLARIELSKTETLSPKEKQLLKILALSEICYRIAKKEKVKRLSLGFDPQSFHPSLIEKAVVVPLYRKGIIHWMPLLIEDKELIQVFKNMELESHLGKLEAQRYTRGSLLSGKKDISKRALEWPSKTTIGSIVNNSIKSQRKMHLPRDNPNVFHDIINAGLKQEKESVYS